MKVERAAGLECWTTMSSSSNSLSPAASSFVEAAREFWHALNDGRGSKVANTFSAKAERIVEEWKLDGSATDNLEALLSHTDSTVQYAAAAELLKSGETRLSLPVLENLSKDPAGLIAPTAKLLLMTHKRVHVS